MHVSHLSFLLLCGTVLLGWWCHLVDSKDVCVTLIVEQAYVTVRGFEKTVITFNGSFPGPELRVALGDVLRITVINKLYSSIISIHWHGMRVPQRPYMDGLAYVTQCGIMPMESFTYIVEPTHAGTFWYHGHVAEDRVDSLFGALIVVPPSYPFTFDHEMVWQLSDFYTSYDVQIYTGLDARPFRFPGNPSAFPLNGAVDALLTPALQLGKTYLVRLINAGALSYFNFSIAGHSVVVVEMQGTYTRPVTVNNIYINDGQRVTFLLYANNSGCWQVNYNMLGPGRFGYGKSYLAYEGANCNSSIGSMFVPSSHNDLWNQSLFVDKDGPLYLPHPNKVIPITVRQVRTGPVNPMIKWSLNNYTFVNPVTPIIFSYYYNHRMNAYNYPVVSTEGEIVMRTYIIDIDYGDVIDFYFINLPRSWDNNSEQHPMHLHGHSFWLLGWGVGLAPPPTNSSALNLVDPVLMDTFTLPAYGWAVVRLKADNPGVWMVHCHTAWHSRMGMGLVLAYPGRTLPRPPDDFPVCGELSCKAVDVDNETEREGREERGERREERGEKSE